MKTLIMADPVRYARMTTEEIRDAFLLNTLYQPGKLLVNYVELERAVVGYAAPVESALELPTFPELRAEYFLERRELGVLNIGGAGTVTVEGKAYDLNNLDVLYIGKGTKKVSFASKDKTKPAIFYLLSYPAHMTYPVALVRKEDANPTEMGSQDSCNKRTICKYIHLEGARSCQLVMGVTHLHPGNVWNSFPPHTHMRRSEIYMYFNLPENERMFHMMGQPQQTKHIVMADKDVVVSPLWSIHAGVGYTCVQLLLGHGWREPGV
jgi:4-deoxy-L-threo-5-hexosulose-uronate ketol-isomerase